MKHVLAAVAVCLASPALAQTYAPPSEALWNQMIQALDAVSMPGSANRQVLQILHQVQQQAQAEAARAKPAPEKKE